MLCPFKFKEFTDESRQRCHGDCAMLMDNSPWINDVDEIRYACAFAVNASSVGAWVPTNTPGKRHER